MVGPWYSNTPIPDRSSTLITPEDDSSGAHGPSTHQYLYIAFGKDSKPTHTHTHNVRLLPWPARYSVTFQLLAVGGSPEGQTISMGLPRPAMRLPVVALTA